ncbi:unnamed protein product [Caenorhabditis brenneri]
MYCQLLTLTLLSSLIVTANQCAATSTTTTPSPATTVAPTACATCTAALIGIVTGNDGDTTPTSALGTDAAGCATITYTCERNPVVATDVVLITYYSDSQNPTDVGTENGVGTANVVMNCVNGVWVKDGIEINDIECQIIT